MPYQSCKYAPPPSFEGQPQQIVCTDENGTEWWLTEDCEQGDWLRYVEEGKSVEPYEPPDGAE